jgi:hypothetical protein
MSRTKSEGHTTGIPPGLLIAEPLCRAGVGEAFSACVQQFRAGEHIVSQPFLRASPNVRRSGLLISERVRNAFRTDNQLR